MSVDPPALAYDGDGLVACICQDAATGDVLMLAWANREAVERTLATGRAWFWSRSRGELWEKGATSGNTLAVVDVGRRLRRRCAVAAGGAARPRLPYRGGDVLGRAVELPGGARAHDRGAPRGRSGTSYVARLLNGPREHAARKVGEEATEVLLAEPGSDEQVGRGRRPALPRARPAGTRRPRSARRARRASPAARSEALTESACVVGGLEASGSGSRLEDPVGTFSRAGSAPAKPLGSLGSLSGPRVAAGLAVGRPQSPATIHCARQADRRTIRDLRTPR